MARMCRAAVEAGIPEIGFTEHLDLLPFDPGYATFQVDAWWKELEHCRAAFAPDLTIRAGVEISEPHRVWHAAEEAVRRHPWDYIVGALHFVGTTLIFDRAYFDRSAEEAYGGYFEELAAMVGAGRFDVLAHMDIVKRYGHTHYGPYDPRPYEGRIRPILRACAKERIAVEVNSSTLRRPVGELCPDTLLLSWFRQEGGDLVTIGSDAHLPGDVGAGLKQAMAALRAAGFQSLTRYEHRQATLIPIPEAQGS
jgi:histidinol-phosphatase (PHP family)